MSKKKHNKVHIIRLNANNNIIERLSHRDGGLLSAEYYLGCLDRTFPAPEGTVKSLYYTSTKDYLSGKAAKTIIHGEHV